MTPVISIIVPVYNAEKYISKCVESIIVQTYRQLEIILVNDGSSDSSPQICDLLAKKDNRIKVIHKRNGGVSSARNEGLKIAQGEYIGFVDSDDWIEEDFFNILYNSIVKDNADISICGYLNETSKGEIISPSTTVKESIIFNNVEAIRAMFEGSIFMGHLWNKLYRADFIKKNSFEKDIHMFEDLLFNVQAMINVTKIVFVPSFGYHYVRHIDSACTVINYQYTSIINAYKIMRILINEKLPAVLSYCNKSEIRAYILTVIRIIENGSSDERITKMFVKSTRELILYTKNKRNFGLKYLLLGSLLSSGYTNFKFFYLMLGKKML
ncbi:glycosyltransferase [Peribacillus frigoritolerans]|uniref:glycosyltransferase n=1 Tax=Peribacillus frigoritolerans TaxID=450367 RepID=UPI001F4FA22F|nr:glycosyltransferase [Peribacillus frigoritolerans]MCK2016877.1 glycosyltransferase [Peribacillus frigoritolerans]